MPTQKTGDAWQWLSVNEDRILLHDGIVLLVDYIAVPSGISDSSAEDVGLPALDGKTPAELTEIIHRECGVKMVTFASLLEYRCNALKGLWKTVREIEKKNLAPHTKKELANNSRSSNTGASFSSRISLVLIFPIMKSLSKFDPNLSSEAASVLLETLRACEPLSLHQESQDCISGLESLLHSWLNSVKECNEIPLTQVQNAASALVALSVAVGTGTLLLRTVHLLHTLKLRYHDMRLLVPGILGKLLNEHMTQEECTVLCAEAHVISWNYDDAPVTDGKEASGSKSICSDGRFVYSMSSSLKHLMKLGTGKNGSIRAYLYARVDVEGGWIVWVNERLLHVVCKKAEDKELDPTFIELDPCTLKPCGSSLTFSGGLSEPVDTLQVASDGVYLYWVYMTRSPETIVHPVTGEKVKQHHICVQPLQIQGSNIALCSKCVTLQRGVEAEKGSEVMRSLVRNNPAAITALLGGSRDENVATTTIGLSIKTLQNSTAYVTGSAVIFLVPPTTSAGARSLFGSTVLQSSKASCVSLCFSLSSGKFISQQELIPATLTQCALSRSTSLQGIAACYDAKSHCVWTLCDNGVDIWDCAGRCRVALHQVAQRLAGGGIEKLIPSSSSQLDTIGVAEAISLMLRHIGIESCQIAPSRGIGTAVMHSLPLLFLQQCCDQLEWSLEEKNWPNVQAIVITLQAVVPGFMSGQYPVDKLALLKERIRQLAWSLLTSPSCPPHIIDEAKRVISNNVEVLFLDHGGAGEFLHALRSPDEAVSPLASLRDEVFIQVAQSLNSGSFLSPHMLSLCNLLSEVILEDSVSAMRRGRECQAGEYPTLLAQCPVLTPGLQCAAALLNVALRQLVLAAEEGKEVEASQKVLMELCDQLQLFKACQTALEELCESARVVSSIVDEQTRAQRTVLLDRLSKGTVVGSLLLPILVIMSNPNMGTLTVANSLQRHLNALTQLSAEVCALLYGGMLESTQVRIPAPWATGRVVETIHPVRDNYKFKDTVSFPGARNLYLKFDGRCASQYDYDKVIVFAGDSTSSPKVAEYGGNTHGYGSRSVLGKGWPKDMVKVEGDAVTFLFEMKSGREQSTPDKAMWGFACTVRPQESAEDSPSGLPFFLDLYLSLASVCCSLILKQYSGPDLSEDEMACKELLSSELLQRCVWQENQALPQDRPVQFKPSPHQPLPPTVIAQLRAVVGKPQPTLRPSTCELLQPDVLEDVVLRACLKQYRLEDCALHVLGPQEHPLPHIDTTKNLLSGIFTRINALERRLQALVELEKTWWIEVQEIVAGSRKPTEAYFFDLLQHETSLKSFELLCCLKNVELNNSDVFATAKALQCLMEKDVETLSSSGLSSPSDYTPLTSLMVAGVIAQARFILSVTLSQDPPLVKMKSMDDTYQQHSSSFSRSMSVPGAPELGHRFSRTLLSSRKSSLLDVSDSSESQSNLLDQIFKFIGSKPEQAVTCDTFLSAANVQRQRGVSRVCALRYLCQLLSGKHICVAVEHVLACVGRVLQQGPKVKDVACGGMAQPVREAFADVMCAVVHLASKQPAACINTIAALCIIPYTRSDEACIVRSGLVKLLDQLCSLMDAHRPIQTEGGEDEALQRVTVLAWAAFQVLAERCVSWEAGNVAAISSGLAHQVSTLLTNHLSRTMEALVLSEVGASEGLQDVLSLLLELGRSQMGKAILSQPTCVSKLLLLLTDQRPSPKLVLIALQLCRIALPLMTPAECSKVTLPFHPSLSISQDNMATGIVSLLLAKLADYIVADASQVQAYQETAEISGSDGEGHSARKSDECDENGQASVYVYKREHENAAEILQPLISVDPRHGRSGHHGQEGLAVKLDRELSEHGRAEILTDTYRVCVRKALRWSSLGLVVSVGPPSGGAEETPGGVVDKRRAQSESAAKKRNLLLIKSDPPRPFVSGHVAYSLAGEVIGLLHSLLTQPGAAEVWGNAIKKVLTDSLELIPCLVPRLVAYTEHVHMCAGTGASSTPPDPTLQSVYIANATFAALGGFREGIRPGMCVQLTGEGVQQTCAVVQSISEQRGMANVHFPSDDLCFGPGKVMEVPIARLLPPQKETLPLEHLGIRSQLFSAVCSLLATSSPSITLVHSSVDATFSGLGMCRLFAELRTRAAMALAHHVHLPYFAELARDPECVTKMMALAQQCSPELRLNEVESRCQSLRMMYRDCSRPPPPQLDKPQTEPKRIELDTRRSWPPVTSCCFTHNLTSVTYQGSGGGQEALAPKGVMLFATTSVPHQAAAFYWELELCLIAESSDVASAAMGYSFIPPKQQGERQQAWQYPQETCLIRSSGRACQVRGESQLDWGTFRTDSALKSGDVVGCGWVRQEGATTGKVYFTVNGHKLEQEFLGVPPEMFPFVHVQKKATRVRVNFGDRPFFYGEGHTHRNAAELNVQTTEEVAANFEALPFAADGSDSEGDGDEGEVEQGGGAADVGNVRPGEVTSDTPSKVGDENNRGTQATGGVRSDATGSDGTAGKDSEKDTALSVPAAEGVVQNLAQSVPAVRVLKVPTALPAYNTEAFLGYQLLKSFDNMLESGRVWPGGNVEEEVEEEGTGVGGGSDSDLHALLVKAWEAKVFPVIQRRFRNDQERKSGLEQIRGALQLGMETIAQETVEFLYEENGGMPKDLQLPTMDSVKAELGKFTIDKVKKGSAVVVQKEIPCNRFGVRTMLKTQGLTGIVLAVDEANELVQVECYLQSEGALVRFWYPVIYLERPPPGYRRSASLRATDAANMTIHRQLLTCESSLTNMYSRKALLTIHKSCTNKQLELMQEVRMVANECIAGSHVDGTSATTSLVMYFSPTAQSHALTPSPLNLFFSVPQRLHDILSTVIQSSAGQLENTAMEMCAKMQNLSNRFGSCVLKVTEGKEATDITYPESAFMLVSCLDDKTQPQAGSTTSKSPWARLCCYRGGQGKAGKQQLQEVVRYPNEIQQSQSQYCGPLYPSVLVPCNLIHVKWGGCPSPGKVLAVTAIPEDLPLCLSFIHTLSHCPSSAFDDKMEYCKALAVCSDTLISLLTFSDCPLLLKETIFHQLAEVLWTLQAVSPDDCTVTTTSVSFTEFSHKIREEVLLLYEAECSAFVTDKGKAPGQFPPQGSIVDGDVGKFSTYFQALLELVLATQQCIQKGLHGSPSPTKKRKSRKGTKKDADGGDSKKGKKMEWLSSVASAAALLQALAVGQEQSINLESSLPSYPCHRLLVVTNLNPKLSYEAVKQKLCKVCRAHGGLYKNTVYLHRTVKTTSEGPSEGSPDHTHLHAVLELCCSAKVAAVIAALAAAGELQSEECGLGVCAVGDNLRCGEEEEPNRVLAEYLCAKLVQDGVLVTEATQALTSIFNSSGAILKADIQGSSLELFFNGCGNKDVLTETLWSTFGSDSGALKLDGLLKWVLQQAQRDVISVWRGLFAAGYDLLYQRCGFPANSTPSRQLTYAQQVALVEYVDTRCRHLVITSAQLYPWDIVPLEASLTVSEPLQPLQGLSLEDLRLGFLQLNYINSELSKLLLAVDLRYTHPLSLGSLIAQLSPLMFYDVKMSFMHAVLNASTRRSWDQAPPEIKMDPLQSAIAIATCPLGTQFCQAAQGMTSVPSSQLCVPLARGGDPTYAFNVKLTGEEVLGTSGSFRHFLWQVVRELQSPVLPIILPCPSGAAGVNKGKYILMPGPHTYSEEKLLQFFGQLLGVAVRADLPIALDFLPCFWKSLCGYRLGLEDLKDADCLTYKLTRKLLECKSAEEFGHIAAAFPRSHGDEPETTSCGFQFVYTSMDGREVELCPGGRDRPVTFENCVSFAQAVERLRLEELSSPTRMDAIRQGLASVVPLQLLRILTVHDLDLRVCGLPDVDLDYLKSHTMYQVGLTETDQHIQYFWNALEYFTQEELRKFIKFACNQERIPFGHPCRDGGTEHVPPYPMKIAPPDGKGPPDSRYIRAETCLFMIKLPQYSSQDIMTERLHYAIYCREDPLSG